MTCAKYVVIKKDGFEQAIVFSHLMCHSTFSKLCCVSAGTVQIFVSINDDQDDDDCLRCDAELMVNAYGKSTTLDLESRPEDSAIIRKSIEQQNY